MFYLDETNQVTITYCRYFVVVVATLNEAREKRDEAKKLLINGIDPGDHKKASKQSKQNELSNSFEIVARE